MAKQWYTIETECIKYNASLSMLVGEKIIVAKVKSKGLAYYTAQTLENIYKPEYFKISIK